MSSNKESNGLACLIGAYDSDSDTEERDTWLENGNKDRLSKTSWTQCFDKKTKHPYYWNIETNSITWTIPEEYSRYLEFVSKHSTKILANGQERWTARQAGEGEPLFYVDEIYRVVSWEMPAEYVNNSNVAPTLNHVENNNKTWGHLDAATTKATFSYSTGDKIDNFPTSQTTIDLPDPSIRSETPPLTLFSANTTVSVTDIMGEDLQETKTPDKPPPEPANNQKRTSSEPDIVVSAKRKRRIEIPETIYKSNVKESFEVEAGIEINGEDASPLPGAIDGAAGKVHVGTNTDNAIIDCISEKDNEGAEDSIKSMTELVSGKIKFLSEGRPAVSGVQAMAIQLETLLSAFETKDLTAAYIRRWLGDTSTNLQNLEQDVAPTGWECKWDRQVNRYFYRNLADGKIQWEFPQPDVVHLNDEMEISTTPPHESENGYSFPFEGQVGAAEAGWNHQTTVRNEGEAASKTDRLNVELDSFYSVIATLESDNPNEPPASSDTAAASPAVSTEEPKKADLLPAATNSAPEKAATKKSKKVKTSLSDMRQMSQLITKWQKAQHDL